MALIGKKSYLGNVENNITGSSQLVSRDSKFTPVNINPTKYYQTVGQARRSPSNPILGATSFGNDAQGIVTGGTNIDPDQYFGFMTTEVNDRLITEDDNNIIL